MKTIFYVTFFVACMISACQGQETKKEKREIERKETSHSVKPKVNIRVNKKYDKRGNLVAFDSTYTAYYSNGKPSKMLLDSLIRDFRPSFSNKFPFMKDERFDHLFYSDTLNNDFFHEDFFRKRMEMNDSYIQEMMREMDSVKNAYFKSHGKRLEYKKGK